MRSILFFVSIDGDWICIEVGDGQVSSLPEPASKTDFYKNIFGAK